MSTSNLGAGAQITETKHGIVEIKDIINLFGYDVKIPSETIGDARLKTRDQIIEEFPIFGQWMRNLKVFTNHLKNIALDTSVDAYKARVHNIPAGLALLNITSRMQFHRAFNDYVETYFEDDVGWGLFRIEPTYNEGKIISVKAFIGEQEINLDNPVPVQLIDWDGRLCEEYDLVNLALGDQSQNFVPALRVNDASLGNQTLHDQAEKRHGALNKSDIRKTMTRSIMDFPLMRIITDKDDDLAISSYETPVFRDLDYNPDIPLMEHLKMLKLVEDLKEAKRFNNVREFALLNLFRWGILDKLTWDRGVSITNAIMNALAVAEHPDQTIVDNKLVSWAMAVLDNIHKKDPTKASTLSDEIFIAGANISKIASMLSRSYLILEGLIVTDVVEDDVGFRPARLALRSKREITKRFQSINRMNTDLYKIVEVDENNNILGIINPIDIMAFVNYDIEAVVIQYEDTVNNDPEQNKFYQAINDYKPA